MVNAKMRWDFVGLSTDNKPTPDTSPKVVDGSTYYCSDTSKLYVFCRNNWYERKPLGGGGGGTTYTAGDGITIADDTISVDTTTIQEKLTAGTGIDITNNTISATGGGGDTVYSTKTTSNTSDGGAVYIGPLNASQEEQPDPTTTDNHRRYFWALPFDPSGNPLPAPGNSTINIGGVQVGGGTNNVTLGYFTKCTGEYNTIVGSSASSDAYGSCTSFGQGTECHSNYGLALGRAAVVLTNNVGSVALGSGAETSRAGEINVGTKSSYKGTSYNNTGYRVIGGVHDGQLAQDAVTVNQVNSVIDAINAALSTNISHIGA